MRGRPAASQMATALLSSFLPVRPCCPVDRGPPGGHQSGIDDAGIVALCDELTPVMGTGARFRGDHRNGRIGEERKHFTPRQRFPGYDVVVVVDTADGEGILGEIDTETDNMRHGFPHSSSGLG